MIRKAAPGDVRAIVALALPVLEDPDFLIDREKVSRVMKLACSGSQHFAWVAEKDRTIVGFLVAITQELPFFERKKLCVVAFNAKGYPWEGRALFRRLMAWADSRPVIKAVVFECPHESRLLERMGFKSGMLYVR